MTTQTREKQSALVTYERYMEEFRTQPPSMRPVEIINGKRYVMTSPFWKHQRIVARITQIFLRFEEASHRGEMAVSPMDVLIRRDPLTVRQPDVLFISNERLERMGGAGFIGPITEPPELVVEVLSESDTTRRLKAKIEDYCALGVLECWLVDPVAETVEQLRLTPQGQESIAVFTSNQTFISLAFPDLTVPVSDIFLQ
jgi:Uma2 family endonuclease